MGPNEFDKIVKEQLQQSNDLYQHELNSAKPFVWSAVQQNLRKDKFLTWRHLAAAMILLLLSFSMVFYISQNRHQNELAQLQHQVDQLKERYQTQVVSLDQKEAQMESLSMELHEVKLDLQEVPAQPEPQKELVRFSTDTVFIKQIEYINTPSESNEVDKTPTKTTPSEMSQTAELQENKIEDAIFPDYRNLKQKQKAEPVKLKFGTFTARKN